MDLTNDQSEVLMPLLLRRAQGHRPGDWGPHDYDVLDGDSVVGRIHLLDGFGGSQTWFWGLRFEAQLDSKNRYGHAESREEAMAAFKAEYERWLAKRE